MIKITEITKQNQNVFTYEIIDGDKAVYAENITFKLISRNMDGKEFFQIYTPDHKTVFDAFVFLNYEEEKHSINSRSKSAQCLKLLFTFEKIIHKNFSEFNSIDVNNLKHFLRGISPQGSKYEFNIQTKRSNATINSYLAVYRQYAKFLNISNAALMRKNARAIQIPYPGSEANFSVERYTSNERVPKKVIEVPWYISVDNFKNIIEEIRKNYTVRDEIIVRLMFQCGLRIGEVLGLTAEDLVTEKVSDTYIPIGYIRNRLSDSEDQFAKTCMKVHSINEYTTREYHTLNFGYQRVVVPFDLFDLINEYIEDAHIKARDKDLNKYWRFVEADKVTDYEDEQNYYIFINSKFSPLTAQLWNTKLRKIFEAVGIAVDKEKRTHNLNHRFRHGFAMFHVQHLNYKSLELMERMRHSSVASVEKYYKPTLSDAIQIKTEFADSLYELIPSLSFGGSKVNAK